MAIWGLIVAIGFHTYFAATARTRELEQWELFERQMVTTGLWRYCPECGAGIPVNAVLCRHCQHRVSAPGLLQAKEERSGVPRL